MKHLTHAKYRSALLAILSMLAAPLTHAGDWLTLPQSNLEIQDGSALDFTGLTHLRPPESDARIHIEGKHFVLSDTREPIRFFCVTLAFGPNQGGFPDHITSDRIATQIRRAGYNAVRFHFADAMLMTARFRDFDYDPDQLDRMDFLLAALKRQGLFLILDMMTSWNGSYGDVHPHRWAEGTQDTKVGVLIGYDRDHWLKMVQTIWMRPNAYLDGKAVLLDPAVAAVILVNEGETDFILRKGNRDEFAKPFSAWLMRKYGSEAEVAKAWGEEWKIETFALPRVDQGDQRSSDFQEFAAELQDDTTDWMVKALRTFGYSGVYTTANASSGDHSAYVRRGLPFVDNHHYVDHPIGGMVEAGTRISKNRLLEGKSWFFHRLTWTRMVDRPFTVTEYGQPFWNPWRYEVSPITAAMARLHGWDLICHFGTGVALTRPGPGRWGKLLVPFEVGEDATLRAGETVASFIFGRGDASKSRGTAVWNIESKEAARASSKLDVPWSTSEIQYVVATATRLTEQDAAANPNEVYLSKGAAPGATELLTTLRANELVPRSNRSNPARHLFESSTGEFMFDFNAYRFQLVTEGTIGIIGGQDTRVETETVDLEITEGEGSAFISALSSKNLRNAKRALLVVATDTRNMYMTFGDREAKTLSNIGSFPLIMRDATVMLRFKHALPAQWQLWALDAGGRRTRELKIERKEGAIETTIHLGDLGQDLTNYFELVREGH